MLCRLFLAPAPQPPLDTTSVQELPSPSIHPSSRNFKFTGLFPPSSKSYIKPSDCEPISGHSRPHYGGAFHPTTYLAQTPRPTRDAQTHQGGSTTRHSGRMQQVRIATRCIDRRGQHLCILQSQPPLLAQVCYSSRQYTLEQYGLADASNKAIQKRRSNNKRRWAYECPISVVEEFVFHREIVKRARRHGIHTLSAEDLIVLENDEDLSLSLPLDVLLQDHDRVILDLNTLRDRDEDPFQNLALLDFLLSARDHKIAIALPSDIFWHSSTDRCLDRNPSLAYWAHRKCRWVSINDTAAFRELVRNFDHVSSERLIDYLDVAKLIVWGDADSRRCYRLR